MQDNIVNIGRLGFGNSIQGADIARRYLNGQKTLILVMNWGFHNSHLSKIWCDLSFLYIKTCMNFDILDKNRILRNSGDLTRMYLDRLTIILIKIISKAEVYRVFDLYLRSMNIIDYGHDAAQEYRKLHPNGNAFIYASWAELIKKSKVKGIEYPSSIRKKLYSKVNSHFIGDLSLTDTKICCIHNRKKGIGTKNNIKTYTYKIIKQQKRNPFQYKLLILDYVYTYITIQQVVLDSQI